MTQEVTLTHEVEEIPSAPTAPTSTIKKLTYSVIIALILCLGFIRVVDDMTHQAVDTSLVNAGLSFAVARALDAGITVAQSTELDIIVASVTIGELLNPISDLVDKFSWVMLLAMTSLGIQKFILVLMSSSVINIILALSGSFCLVSLWLTSCEKFKETAFKYFKLIVFIRFAIVITLMLNILVETVFIKEDIANSNANVASLVELVDADKMDELSVKLAEQNQVEQEESSVMDNMKAKWQSVKNSASNSTNKIANLSKKVEAAVADFINLMTLFLLKTLFIPLFFLWMMKSLFTKYCN